MNTRLIPLKFHDSEVTADGQARAHVVLNRLTTLWFNTGTRCNITCRNCYIESSPHNDRLAYIAAAEVERYLDEIRTLDLPTTEIGLTGGEPFLNPHVIDIMRSSLARNFRVLVLTNALRPLQRWKRQLLELQRDYGAALTLRVSLDHYDSALHETERGARTYAPALAGLKWLSEHGF